MMLDWSKVAEELENFAYTETDPPEKNPLDLGQRATIAELARRIRSGQRAALLADEVGMGKTRIAVALIEAVRRAGGRSAIVLPAGLGAQWQQELRGFDTDDRTLLPLRSYDSFIAGFLADADAEGSDRRKRSHKQWLQDRRQQRELPENGWAAEPIIMISHTFAAMRFPSHGDGPVGGWRRELLPNVSRLVGGRRRNFMRDSFHDKEVGYVFASRRAALAIAETILKHDLPCDLDGDQKWLAAEDYKRKILPLIGYGLGQFDLVVVDEAHKARGADSSLSQILGPVSWECDDPFRLGMTATPVELNADQWIDTLSRISGRDDKHDLTVLGELSQWISGYIDSVRRIQAEELEEPLTAGFENAATRFRDALRPFVLRRDKRDDPEFRAFHDAYGDYRVVADVRVSPETSGFNHDWLRRFCAAEALSMLPQDDPRVKRTRLSVAQGYGFGLVPDGDVSDPVDPVAENDGPHSIWLEAFTRDPTDIHDHPAILAAMHLIEDYTAKGEKVLVFGRFIKPLDALTRLLDAREMLRRLRDGQHWPASSVRQESISAVCAAMSDPKLWTGPAKIECVDQILKDRYGEWSSHRRSELARLHRDIGAMATDDEHAALLVKFLQREDTGLHGEIGALLEALEARRVAADRPWTSLEILGLFRVLLTELSSDDEGGDDDALQNRLALFLQDYAGREGSYARMMSGETRPQTRRLLQAAFNRAASWPMVLLAQSRVGREGLNLHEACRTVVLLHAEWNPGIVEQQIGRVDRKNSRWLSDLRDWNATGGRGDPPRIRIHPIVVSGTYDDHNWQVLKERWLELRAQLHGDVLPKTTERLTVTEEKKELMQRIRSATPKFSPPALEK